jgi:hypothetical protein
VSSSIGIRILFIKNTNNSCFPPGPMHALLS